MTRMRFVLLAVGASTVFFVALVGFLLLAADEETVATNEIDDINWEDFDLSKMTPEQLERLGRRRIEAMARASSSYVAIREKYGDEGIARIIVGIRELGDEDWAGGSGKPPVIVIEMDTLTKAAK